MIDLPSRFPMYTRDLKQLLDEHGNPKFAKPENEHHALADARWAKDVFFALIDEGAALSDDPSTSLKAR